MNTTGIVRTVDNLGRIVLPKEMRDVFSIEPGTPMEITVSGETLVLRKYRPTGGCVLCDRLCGDMVVLHGKRVCADCRRALAGLSPLQGG